MRLLGTVVNAVDPDALACFYADLLGWPRIMDEADWKAIRPTEGGAAIAFQRSQDRVHPVWPTEPGRQQSLLHLDFGSTDLESDVERASALGATLTDLSQSGDERVLIDPEGNPFCLIRVGDAPSANCSPTALV